MRCAGAVIIPLHSAANSRGSDAATGVEKGCAHPRQGTSAGANANMPYSGPSYRHAVLRASTHQRYIQS